MPSLGGGYGDRRRDRSEGTIRAGSVWPIKSDKVTPTDDLLLDAAMRCDVDEVEACIDAKANPTADGPMLLAANNGGVLVVNRLAELGANVNAPGAYGKTPLICAAEKGHADVVAALIASGAELDTGLVPGGQTALHLAGSDEQCPLQMARMTCHLLLERHADPLLRDRWGHTAEQFHRLQAGLPPGRLAGDRSAAPKRDGRSVMLADMIRERQRLECGLMMAMQKLCWMRLLQRNHSNLEMSLGAASPAFVVTFGWTKTQQPTPMSVYDRVVIRILQQADALVAQASARGGEVAAPYEAALSRHLHGLRSRDYFENLPSYQVFAELQG